MHLIGKSEACSACGTVFDVRGLVLGEDGAICMDCDLEQQEDERYAGGRWDVTNLLAVLFLFLVSALGGAAALGEVHGAGYPLRDEAIITLATGLFGALSALATITSIRELPFDLPGRDAVVLTKRAATITLGWAAFAISVWAFITLLMV